VTQIYYDDCYNENNEADSDLSKIENNFIALKSNFSGDTEPTDSTSYFDVEPYMLWGDTNHYVLRMAHFDYGSSAFTSSDEPWLGLMFGDEDQKVWVYRDDAMDGWVVDSTVEDTVCAVSGGDVYDSPGSVSGTWAVGYPIHNHCWFKKPGSPTGKETMFDADGNEQDVPYVSSEDFAGIAVCASGETPWHSKSISLDYYTDMSDSSTETSEWRPAAAVGTLQYINI